MPWLAPILSALSLGIALIVMVRTFVRGGRDHSEHLQQAISTIQERCALLEMKMGMFWRLVEEHLSDMLKKPTHLEMDALLDKLKQHTLTLDEAHLLRSWVQRVYLDGQDVRSQQRLIAILVMGAIGSLISEFERGT